MSNKAHFAWNLKEFQRYWKLFWLYLAFFKESMRNYVRQLLRKHFLNNCVQWCNKRGGDEMCEQIQTEYRAYIIFSPLMEPSQWFYLKVISTMVTTKVNICNTGSKKITEIAHKSLRMLFSSIYGLCGIDSITDQIPVGSNQLLLSHFRSK